ncbi:MAG: lyase family protein, partial [Flavobacteriaceae bacterium]|nr:lyase family protein [Flavobacteriaceae bacterium]
MKLWNKNDLLNKKIEKFTVGNDRIYDLYIAKYDIKASIVHAKMLNKSKIISNNEMNLIIDELNVLNTQILKGDFIIEDEFEDIHSKIEFILTKKLGDTGKKIHTGRSRNDQVLVATQLYLKDQIIEIKDSIKELFETLIDLA